MSKIRDGFTFYRSYFDVYNELSEKDKVAFMDALLKKQFEGEEPTSLKGMANFAYLSQKHSIDKQVKGWEDKTKCKLLPLARGVVRGEITPTQQEKEKEEEKEEVQGKEEVQEELPPKKSKKQIPSLDEFLNYVLTIPEFAPKFESLKYSIQSKYEQWIENGWKDGHGNEIKQWKTKLKNTLPHLKPLNTLQNGTTKSFEQRAEEFTARILGINPTQGSESNNTNSDFEEADWSNAD